MHFIIASCENMVAAKGLRPGDILTAASGARRLCRRGVGGHALRTRPRLAAPPPCMPCTIKHTPLRHTKHKTYTTRRKAVEAHNTPPHAPCTSAITSFNSSPPHTHTTIKPQARRWR